MTKLLKKIFEGKNMYADRTRLSVDEIKPFFESLGVDIETEAIVYSFEVRDGKLNLNRIH